jgi:hypothetical protein
MAPSLCESCRNVREVRTVRSRFLLCQLSATNDVYPKYPPQPVVRCDGYQSENKEHPMVLTPLEAIDRIDESVTVEMLVQRTKCCTGSKQVFLDSERNHRDPKNLGVVVTESGRTRFSEAGIEDPTAHFKGKTIRVRGVVIRKEKGPYIEVNEASQIELVK